MLASDVGALHRPGGDIFAWMATPNPGCRASLHAPFAEIAEEDAP